jgi:ATP-binding cassette subfamily C protein/ATP-binding cassette subfamily C protein EexD
MAQGMDAQPLNLLQQAVRACRAQFAVVGVFSMFVNLLMLTTSIYMMQVFDRVLATRSTDTLLFLTLIAIGATLLMALLEFARGQVLARCAAWIEQTVAPEAFSRAIEAQLRNRPYRMEAMRDLAVCRGFLQSPGMTALYDVPWVPIYLGFIFLLHPALGWIATGGAVLLFLLTLANEWTTSSLLKKANVAAMANQRRSESVVRNAEVIDSMGMLPNVLRRWQDGVTRMLPAQQSAADRAGVIMGLTKFFRLTVQIAVLGVGALLVLENLMTAGAMIAGSIIMGRALAPVEQMIGAWKQLVSARQSYRRLSAHLTVPRIRPGGMPLPEPTGRLSLERVTYAFPGTNVPIIKGVGFALDPGESCAIIGPSAAGKTTLIRLVIGVLEPNAGTVRLDGANVFQWLREDFGRHVGYLPQDVELFDGTVVENIARMGTPDPESVFAAAKLAGCHEMILKLPKGYETEIGESGTFVSGGQRQMIGLARALYGQPKLIVLDEPNSNLDGDGEQALLRALEQVKAVGTTVVLVSHRPALVQGVDKVVVLRDGMVEMFGPRQEVLKKLLQPARPTEVAASGAPPRLDDRRAAP